MFRESETLFDKTTRKAHIRKAIYCQKFQRYIICDQGGAGTVTIASERSHNEATQKQLGMRDMANRLEQEQSVRLDFKKAAHILHLAWSERHQILGLLASDGRLFFYQSKPTTFQLQQLFTIDASELPVQTNLWYMEKHDVWLTGAKDFALREWAIC